MEKKTRQKCYVCKKTHWEEGWRWHKLKLKGKWVFYCRHGIECDGCQELHYNDTGGERVTGDGRHYCRKHYNSSPTLAQKMKNMSPEQILSGEQYGLPNQFGTESGDWRSSKPEILKELQ